MKHYFNFAIKSITHRKVRSWLTILGIIIGIAAIVSLISISQGLENAISAQFEQMGSNKLFVFPSGSFTGGLGGDAGKITENDIDTIKSVPGVDYVNGFLSAKANVFFAKDDKFTTVNGIESEVTPGEMLEGDGLTLSEGRWMNSNEKGVVVIGPSLAEDGFKKQIYVGNEIQIKEDDYEVIGILNAVGNEEDDNSIYVNIDDARTIHEKEDSFSLLEIVTMEGFDIKEVAEKAQQKLDRERDAEDVDVYIPEQILQQLGIILSVLQYVLGGIAGISLFVGGIGIMNSMFTNVLERTKEIGIMKAIGASPKDIKYMFMFESGLMGLVGGLLGALLGVFISLGVGKYASLMGFLLLKIEIEYPIVIFAISFAFIVGIISGYLPANQASKLTPVEALK